MLKHFVGALAAGSCMIVLLGCDIVGITSKQPEAGVYTGSFAYHTQGSTNLATGTLTFTVVDATLSELRDVQVAADGCGLHASGATASVLVPAVSGTEVPSRGEGWFTINLDGAFPKQFTINCGWGETRMDQATCGIALTIPTCGLFGGPAAMPGVGFQVAKKS